MKEHPILFNGEMARAILEGRKTQTRRVIEDPAKGPEGWPGKYKIDWFPWYEGLSNKHPGYHQFYEPRDGLALHLRCPHGIPGDRLYVRETWATRREWDHMKPSGLPADADLWWRADKSSHRALNAKPGKWRPSIHMPKKYARVWLEVVSVRAERLREITVEDARAEGAPLKYVQVDLLLAWLKDTWNSINAKRGHPWSANDWVWATTFDVISTNGAPE